MTINTLMAVYTIGFAIWMLERMVFYGQIGNYFMFILATIALYGPIETLVKYYYIRKEVMAEIEAKNVDKDGNNVDRK